MLYMAKIICDCGKVHNVLSSEMVVCGECGTEIAYMVSVDEESGMNLISIHFSSGIYATPEIRDGVDNVAGIWSLGISEEFGDFMFDKVIGKG